MESGGSGSAKTLKAGLSGDCEREDQAPPVTSCAFGIWKLFDKVLPPDHVWISRSAVRTSIKTLEALMCHTAFFHSKYKCHVGE